MTESIPDRDRQILRAAHDWRTALSMPDVSPAEVDRFRAWLAADERHEAAFDRAETLFQALGTLGPEDLGLHLRPPWHQRLSQRLSSLRVRLQTAPALVGGATACLLLVLVAFTLALTRSDNANGPSAPYRTDYSTGVGEIKSLTLADGSQLTLGARSRASVDIGAERRMVTLQAGDALFDVISEANRPFTVTAGALQVVALGTEFDVRHNGGVSRVAVAEGRVAVRMPEPDAATAANDAWLASLSAGEQVAATTREGLREVEPIDVQSVAAWRSKRLIYNGATLAELVADAQRYSALQITIRDDTGALDTLKVTAFFDGDDVDGMIAALADILPVSVRRTPAGLIEISPQQ